MDRNTTLAPPCTRQHGLYQGLVLHLPRNHRPLATNLSGTHLPLGRANAAGDRTRSGVRYAHDAVPAFETSAGVAAPVPAARRRSNSGRRVLDEVPARPRTGRAPKPARPWSFTPREAEAQIAIGQAAPGAPFWHT